MAERGAQAPRRLPGQQYGGQTCWRVVSGAGLGNEAGVSVSGKGELTFRLWFWESLSTFGLGARWAPGLKSFVWGKGIQRPEGRG